MASRNSSVRPSQGGVTPTGDAVEWLFKFGDLILGPAPAGQILQKLQTGELDGNSQVCVLGQSQFVRLAEVDYFKVHLAKAEAKRRVDQSVQVERTRGTKRQALKIGLLVAAGLVISAACVVGARYVAVHYSVGAGEEEFEIEPPTITIAHAHVNEELIAYPNQGGGKERLNGSTKKAVADSSASGSASSGSSSGLKAPQKVAMADKGRTSGPGKSAPTPASADQDGMQTAQFDQSAINAVVAAKQKTLYACLKQEVQRNPSIAGKIPIEFVIGNDGHVNKLWIDFPGLKEGPMHECMLQELKKWSFKRFEGETPTVGLAFKINGHS